MFQAIQILGSLMVLAAFTALQRHLVSADSRSYLVVNLIGSGILAVLAAIDLQYGFLLLEGSWAVVSAVSLVNVLRSRRNSPSHADQSLAP